MYAAAGILQKAGKTDTESLIKAARGIQLKSPMGPYHFRALDQQSTLGAYVGLTTVEGGKPTMKNWYYADGAKFMPPDDEVKKLRPADAMKCRIARSRAQFVIPSESCATRGPSGLASGQCAQGRALATHQILSLEAVQWRRCARVRPSRPALRRAGTSGGGCTCLSKLSLILRCRRSGGGLEGWTHTRHWPVILVVVTG
jgi:hypothetical protein